MPNNHATYFRVVFKLSTYTWLATSSGAPGGHRESVERWNLISNECLNLRRLHYSASNNRNIMATKNGTDRPQTTTAVEGRYLHFAKLVSWMFPASFIHLMQTVSPAQHEPLPTRCHLSIVELHWSMPPLVKQSLTLGENSSKRHCSNLRGNDVQPRKMNALDDCNGRLSVLHLVVENFCGRNNNLRE